MNLKANINGIEYDITQGFTYKEEYNETLDSASIIIPHVKELDLKPFKDIFVYSTDKVFKGYANVGDKVPVASNTDILSKASGVEKTNIEYELEINVKISFNENGNYKLSGNGMAIWEDYFYNYTPLLKNKCRFVPYLLLNLYAGNTPTPTIKYTYLLTNINGKEIQNNFYDKLYLTAINLETGEVDTSNQIEVSYDRVKHELTIPRAYYDDKSLRFKFVKFDTFERKYYTLRDINDEFGIYLDKKITLIDFDISTLNGELSIFSYGLWHKCTITNVVNNKELNRIELYLEVNNEPETLYFTYNSIDDRLEYIFQNHEKSNPYFAVLDDLKFENVYIKVAKATELPSFFKHYILDNFQEETINIDEDIKTYKIALMSETKALEKIQTPNVSITQSLNVDKMRTCYFYLEQFINLYSPKIKVVKSEVNKTWENQPKYRLDESLKEIYDNVLCPEITFTNPTLKDIITRIMLVKDCIPYVKNNIVYALNITERKGEFALNKDHITSIISSMTSENYTTTTRREYSQSISQNGNCNLIEYLGFRNSDNSLLTLGNLKLETRFPIYKINKLYLCYYKKVNILDLDGNKTSEKVFMCKQDMTKLVLQNKVRNALSKDWVDFHYTTPTTIEEMAQYRICTIGYDIGATSLTGWGETYSFPAGLFMESTKSYIENILDILDSWYIFGTDYIENYGIVAEDIENYSITGTWKDSIITPLDSDNKIYTDIASKIKSVMFEIDYVPLYNGAVKHSKDFYDEDEITTNDNSNSSLSILENDGLFEKEKLNRLGNRIYKIACRYNNLEELEQDNHNLGSVYRDDIIIYSKEVQIYDTCVFAVYLGTKDYVLKNFYTSVFAKLRTYNFMTYDESVTRSENIKKHFLLSPNSCYYEYDTLDKNMLLSAFYSTPIPTIPEVFNYPYKINCGYFTIGSNNYLSDINSFVCGYSLCFNIKMYDNISGGVYINEFATDVRENNETVKGTHQKWNIVVEDNEDAFIQNVGAYVCHIDNNDIFKDEARYYNAETKLEIDNVYKDILFKLPYFDISRIDEINLIGGNFNVCKDNKEVLNYTFQYEIYSLSDDVVYSQWFLKLNDLIATFNKWEEDFEVVNSLMPTVEVQLSTYKYDDINITSVGTQYIQKLRLVAKFTDEQVQSMTKATYFNHSVIWWETKLLGFITTSKVGIKLDHFIELIDENTLIIFGTFLDTFSSKTKNLTFIKTGENTWECTYFTNTYNYVEGDTFANIPNYTCDNKYAQLAIYALTDYNKQEYKKNMYVLTSSNYISKTLYYNEVSINNLPNDLKITDLRVSDVFKVNQDKNDISYLEINKSLLDDTIKSVQYWYLDNDGLFKFVFGTNIKENISKIYISSLDNRNIRVYDYLHNHIGNVSNLVENNETNDYIQHYTLKND